MQGFRLWLTAVCSMQGIRMSPLSHDPFSFPSEEACRFSPPGADSQSLPSAEVFEGLPTGWNFTPQIGFFWHRAHALLALFSIFDNLLISWLQARIVYLSTHRLHSSIALFVRGPLAPL